MPEITREEARRYLRGMAESWERRVAWNDGLAAQGDPHAARIAAAVGDTAAIYRLTLAALEDAERVDALAYDLEGGPIFDALGDLDVHEIAADLLPNYLPTPEEERDAYLRAYRTVVDRARKGA